MRAGNSFIDTAQHALAPDAAPLRFAAQVKRLPLGASARCSVQEESLMDQNEVAIAFDIVLEEIENAIAVLNSRERRLSRVANMTSQGT